MKKSALMLALITNSFLGFSQNPYNVEKTVNIKIRTNSGVVLDETEAKGVLFFQDNTQNLKKCRGVHFSPRAANLKLIAAFGIFIEPSNWKYSPESSNSNMSVYYSSCDFTYFVPDNLNPRNSKKEILLLNYNNGSQAYLVIAYDGENTLIVTSN